MQYSVPPLNAVMEMAAENMAEVVREVCSLYRLVAGQNIVSRNRVKCHLSMG